MDPNWGEEFYLEWGELSSGKRLITLEVWDWDFWRPDELLGRGFISINDLAFEPLEVRWQGNAGRGGASSSPENAGQGVYQHHRACMAKP
jgi:hypothetical protein